MPPHVWTFLFAAALLAGCSPIGTSTASLFTAHKLPHISVAPDSVNLDVAFVERPIGDRLLGDELWNGIDQTAALNIETRTALSRHGFRLGVTGASPPLALQTLLGLSADFADAPQFEKEKKLAGHQTVLRNGWSTEVQIGPRWDLCAVPVHRPGSQEAVERTLESVRCVYKVTAQRVQDGWVRLEFLPQVHHGVAGPVIRPGEAQFEMRHSQRIEEYPHLQFSLTLALGEMAVLTADNPREGTLARLFYLGPESEPKSQRMLVIRLANMGRVDDPYSAEE